MTNNIFILNLPHFQHLNHGHANMQLTPPPFNTLNIIAKQGGCQPKKKSKNLEKTPHNMPPDLENYIYNKNNQRNNSILQEIRT